MTVGAFAQWNEHFVKSQQFLEKTDDKVNKMRFFMANVLLAIKRKGAILMQGYQKHGNAKGFEEVEIILKELNS